MCSKNVSWLYNINAKLTSNGSYSVTGVTLRSPFALQVSSAVLIVSITHPHSKIQHSSSLFPSFSFSRVSSVALPPNCEPESQESKSQNGKKSTQISFCIAERRLEITKKRFCNAVFHFLKGVGLEHINNFVLVFFPFHDNTSRANFQILEPLRMRNMNVFYLPWAQVATPNCQTE